MKKEKLISVLLGITGVICLYLVIALAFWFFNKDKIYPGITAAGINLGGKTKKEAKELLDQKTNDYLLDNLNFATDKPNLVSVKELEISFDNEKTAQNAVNVGSKNPFMLGVEKEVKLNYSFSKDNFFKKINEISAVNTTVAVNSKITQRGNELVVTEGKPGTRLNFAETAHSFINAVSGLNSKVSVKIFTVAPTFTAADLSGRQEEIRKLTDKKIVLKGSGKAFEVSGATILGWVQLSASEPVGSNFYGDSVLGAVAPNKSGGLISDSLVSNYLVSISDKINQSAVNAQLSISGNRANVFVPSRDGLELDVSESALKVINAIEEDKDEVELAIKTKKAEVDESSLNDLGINELIATGYSNFAGSPTNRIHNLRTGAAKFNGYLIKPDATFSFNETLGPVDASTGYLPELVILENKTEPQYGGGMCQVSSTAFRAALNAGLPIVERRYHAYPVQYYKPYGVDATIYLPKPDLVFKNDTGHYILIQTHIEGTKLTFDFYGTKPNRTVKFAGNDTAAGAAGVVEQVNPLIYDKEARGKGSFTAQFWRFIYDSAGNLTTKSTWVSKYDSPDKYPH